MTLSFPVAITASVHYWYDLAKTEQCEHLFFTVVHFNCIKRSMHTLVLYSHYRLNESIKDKKGTLSIHKKEVMRDGQTNRILDGLYQGFQMFSKLHIYQRITEALLIASLSYQKVLKHCLLQCWERV